MTRLVLVAARRGEQKPRIALQIDDRMVKRLKVRSREMHRYRVRVDVGVGEVAHVMVTWGSSTSTRDQAHALLLLDTLTIRHPLPQEQLRGVTLTARWWFLSDDDLMRELDAAMGLGAGVVRLTLPWAVVAGDMPQAGETPLATRADFVIREARARGLRVVVLSGGTPCWLSSKPGWIADRCRPGSDAASYPPLRDEDAEAFYGWLATRFPNVHGIEPWNEPNNAYFFKAPPGESTACAYARVLRSAYSGIKAADRRMRVVGGALAFSDRPFLLDMFACGARGQMDALSIHPFHVRVEDGRLETRSPDRHWPTGYEMFDLVRGLVRIDEALTRNGDPTPLWITEMGYATCRPDSPWRVCVTLDQQADWLTRSFEMVAGIERVQLVTAFTLRDSEALVSGRDFGLLRTDFSRKPAYEALRRTLGWLPGSR